MIGIGIDTGGTCTDAVVCEIGTGTVLASAKTLTTRDDLKKGIMTALGMLPEEYLKKCRRVALSTTLATNACVEDKGGRGKLILLGVNEKVFRETHRSYGIADPSDVFLVNCRISVSGENDREPDWQALRKELPAFLEDCDCVSIVQLFSADRGGEWEMKTAGIVREIRDIPVIPGNELFPDRNAIRRGAGALLNARLIPFLKGFMEAVKEVFSERGIDAPVTIIRSDGSQMSEKFAEERPVETLLCGPAASVIGAHALSGSGDAVIVDMGGTTTDLAIVQDGLPMRAGSGIQVGGWKTFVKGLFIDTFGLGGDSAVRYDSSGHIYLESFRVIPLCMLAAQYPRVREELKKLDASERFHPVYLHEYFTLVGDLPDREKYSEEEYALCIALKQKGPLSMEDAAAAQGRDIYTMVTARLESDGVILRSGMTPTDIMHIRGDYGEFDREASLYAARFMVRSSAAETVEELCGTVYEKITEKLYRNIARVLLQTGREAFAEAPADPVIDELITWNYELAREAERAGQKREDTFFAPLFTTKARLIGVGAPVHIFLPEVGRLLGMEAVVPEHAAVANAVGAVAGQIVAIVEVSIKPDHESGSGFIVKTKGKTAAFETYDEALCFAEHSGRADAAEMVRSRGASGKIAFSKKIVRKEAGLENGTMWLEDILKVTATGRESLTE